MTISAVPYTVISLAVFGMILMVLGMIVDYSVSVDNDLMADPQLHYSYEHGQAMSLLPMCFGAMGFVALICAGIFLIMNGVQSQSGEI